MNWWILIGLAGIVLLGYLANRFGWIDLSNKNKRPGGGGSILSIGDEVFAPSRHEAVVELDRQTVLPAPAPVAGDGAQGVYDGCIRISVDGAGTDTGEAERKSRGPAAGQSTADGGTAGS